MFAGEPKRIKHLHFVTSLQVAAAVGATLTTASRFVRQAELEVQLVTLKLGDAVSALHQQAVLGHLARLEILGGLAIEQHGCALGRLGTERRALADGTVDGERLAVALKRQLAAGDALAGGAAGEGHRVAIACAVVLPFFPAVITGTGQAARVENHFEFAATERNDLRTDVVLAAE